MAPGLHRYVRAQTVHQRMRMGIGGDQFPNNRIGEFGDHIVEDIGRRTGHPKCRGQQCGEFGEPGPLTRAPGQRPARPPLALVAPQFRDHHPGPHPPFDALGDMSQEPQIPGHGAHRQSLPQRGGGGPGRERVRRHGFAPGTRFAHHEHLGPMPEPRFTQHRPEQTRYRLGPVAGIRGTPQQ